MTTGVALTSDDLDRIAQHAFDSGDRAAGAAELVAAVDAGRIDDSLEAQVVLGGSRGPRTWSEVWRWPTG
ncbi:hypothetical protein Ais01nite_32600 [Asanoa ishikariensis]|uniref:Uncharacterized protein n=1 Tax=Asanoa ishikariensis TaxID=137265 RepID=A0A1H3UWM3_9ACTN|nr:hypothetical protein [Asanoa ishikariensis]GIF65225.1 hypothetical protein Ais01nite_32600 [Asanoa ishikariensis]SDZ66686.1 hypothetical protein SAMN05421684_8263 [Asanoa ishikariensis]